MVSRSLLHRFLSSSSSPSEATLPSCSSILTRSLLASSVPSPILLQMAAEECPADNLYFPIFFRLPDHCLTELFSIFTISDDWTTGWFHRQRTLCRCRKTNKDTLVITMALTSIMHRLLFINTSRSVQANQNQRSAKRSPANRVGTFTVFFNTFHFASAPRVGRAREPWIIDLERQASGRIECRDFDFVDLDF